MNVLGVVEIVKSAKGVGVTVQNAGVGRIRK